ncbi:hypothetical protein HG531_001045 [Fusarium graminearum]|nr:hypothetical protein HG531_001045 [Fusarium graminearum]
MGSLSTQSFAIHVVLEQRELGNLHINALAAIALLHRVGHIRKDWVVEDVSDRERVSPVANDRPSRRHHESRRNSSASDCGSRISELSFAAAEACMLAEISAPRARSDLRSVLPDTRHHLGELVIQDLKCLAETRRETALSSGDTICASEEEVWVGNEGLPRLFRISNISLTYDRTLDEQFANSADRDKLVMIIGVDEPDACAGTRTHTDVRLACCAGVDGASNGTLSRTITDDNSCVLTPDSDVASRASLTTDTKTVK